jgi:tetratricopeptide (TPR) repeat protein
VAKSPVPHSVSELAAASPSAADSLKAANKLRGKGRWSEAAQAYSRIARRYPSSAQGSVAALAAAALYLEHLGDPNTALRYYQRSLKTAGLSAEAQYGIANCYRALGNRQAEARWLDRLVKSVPGGLYSDRAQRRLRVLEGSEP